MMTMKRSSQPAVLMLLLAMCLCSLVVAFNSQSTRTCPLESSSSDARATHRQWAQRHRSTVLFAQEQQQRKKCHTCDNIYEKEDETLDRREAVFAMLGTLWALGVPLVQPAWGAAGDQANMQLPNPLQGMADRATKQCIVESLGSRECLVYMDEANKLYQGVDTQVLLAKIEKASTALATLPGLIEQKKWSQVSGIMTGPMGELIRSMVTLADVSEHAAVAKKNIKQVKNDLYAIAAAVDRKDGATALKCHADATKSLVAFVKSL